LHDTPAIAAAWQVAILPAASVHSAEVPEPVLVETGGLGQAANWAESLSAASWQASLPRTLSVLLHFVSAANCASQQLATA
jgi:hypothetical protein